MYETEIPRCVALRHWRTCGLRLPQTRTLAARIPVLTLLICVSCDALPFGVSKIPSGIYEGSGTLTVSTVSLDGDLEQSSIVAPDQILSITSNGLPQDVTSGQEYREGSIIRTSFNLGEDLGDETLSIAVENVIQSGNRVVISGTATLQIAAIGLLVSGPYEARYEFDPPNAIRVEQSFTLTISGEGIITFELVGTLQK